MFSGYSLILWVGGRVVTIALEVFEGELLYQWCPKSLVTLRKVNINFYSADPLTKTMESLWPWVQMQHFDLLQKLEYCILTILSLRVNPAGSANHLARRPCSRKMESSDDMLGMREE